MARHLRSCLPHKEHEKNQKLLNFPPSDANVDSEFGKSQILIGPNAIYDANKMREAIANWLLCTEQPFKTVEDDMYVKMMKTANPLFEKVCRVTATSDCFKVYEHEKKKLKALTKVASEICLTTDCWKSSHQKIEYMVITGHFIDQNWRLQKRVLSFMHVPPPRTGFDIAECIYKCLKEWEIEDKIFTISAYNATYNDRAVKRLKEIFSRWWNMHKLKYRVLSMMARDVLAIPISTVAYEATFSVGGRVIDPYRASLAPDTVQMLSCGGDWIRHLHRVKKKLKASLLRARGEDCRDCGLWHMMLFV
uniref:HAT C-terminal dimerisation domain-containing protein n=1 Tax=Lactuca sativa TaxID=4236 RepID=A0A9R1VMZ4_LACSA|nr:hypothetical protein LSAT_V11C500231030 [Lactuca sativa]